MSDQNPFFSIVIPTRNRAALLRLAVRSILQQSFKDFELIISDNFSSDDTAQIVASFDDRRVKYFRSSRSLTMNESYKFAVSHARGEYVTFLSDDDAFAVGALEKAAEIIETTGTRLFVWRYAFYYLHERLQAIDYPPLHPLRRIKSNSLLIPAFSNRLFEIGATETIERILLHHLDREFSLTDPDYRAAFLTNAVYHRTIFEDLKNRNLDLFPNYVIPDIYAFMLTMCSVENYFYLDAPLTVFCKSNVSTTESKVDKSSFHKSLIAGKEEPFIRFAPLKNLTNQNYIMESSLQALNAVGGEYEKFQLNREKYFSDALDNFLYYEKHGINVKEELAELAAVAAAEKSVALAARIRAARTPDKRGKVLSRLRRFPRPAPITRKMARSRPHLAHTRTLVVQGADGYFGDIAECAAWLDPQRIAEIADFCLGLQNNQAKVLSFKWQID